jgi:hypothetical protein
MESLQLLTIIAEEALTEVLENEIVSLGAKGYTASQVSGKSQSNVRDNPWEGENVKIETIVPITTCLKILDHLKAKYLERYALIAFYYPVNVIRTHHFA